MPNQRYQSIRTFSVSLLVMSLFMLGANMDTPTPEDASFDVDLELTKTCESVGALGGSFHLKVTNNGPGTATDIEVTDDIPAGFP